MPFLNVEIKARISNPSWLHHCLMQEGAEFKGTDKQTDTYFHVKTGRLKLREGNIENNLIWYVRANQAGPKTSQFSLLPVTDTSSLKNALAGMLGIKMIVQKERQIYYIGNVKFHIDQVDGLGSFAEIEAGNILACKSKEELESQCRYYMHKLGIGQEDLIEESYSDLLMKKMAG